VRLTVNSASSANDRNSETWIDGTSTAPVYRTVENAVVQDLPADVPDPFTGTVENVESVSGIQSTLIASSGEIYRRSYIASAWSAWVFLGPVDTAALDALAATDVALQDNIDVVSGEVSVLNLPSIIGRGDAGVIASLDGVPILLTDASGKLRLEFDAYTVALLAGLLGTDIAPQTPQSPDALGDIDGWSVWSNDGLIYFSSKIWGDYPRQYIKRAGGEAWAVSPSEMRLRLVYGDQTGNVTTTEPVSYFTHIAAIGDDAGYDGWNGAVPTGTDAADIVRAGSSFGALLADKALEQATGALHWQCVRSETVEDATVTQLRSGQPLSNLSRVLTEVTRLAALYERVPVVESVSLFHNGDSADYVTNYELLLSAINTAVGPRTIHVFQPAGTTLVGDLSSVLGTVEGWTNKGAIPAKLVSATYFLNVAGGTTDQIDADGMVMLAELAALADANADWIPPRANTITRVGSTITVDFEAVAGSVLIAPTFGLEIDSDVACTILSTSIAAHPESGEQHRLIVNLSAEPVNGVLRYAYEASGNDGAFANRGDMKDDFSAVSITGNTLERYALSFRGGV
jgi:hypothetical protein